MSRKKILVVDDNSDNRDIIIQMLEDTAEIIEASSGAIAVELLADNNIEVDLILLDIIMPELNGYETLKILKSKLKKMPIVIALTALSSEKEIAKTVKAGFNDFIAKPFIYSEFLEKIEDLLTDK